ncbi:transposase [Actinoplanes derwentensis]|uniref:transposase n=1 Tax=Actinoplanes derwentensis TaxID=113562 RepID=UPI001A4F835A|nr:transposase [Actinoplanes derwentensis]GID85567.1 hypothetical protein Ade03nite_44910 [Actinoplanes derwentensis]
MLDAGYEAPRIAWLLRDLPIEILGRTRSDRVLRRATPARVYHPEGSRPARHGGEFVFGDSATWDTEQTVTHTDTRLYGQTRALAQDLRRPWERPVPPERLTPGPGAAGDPRWPPARPINDRPLQEGHQPASYGMKNKLRAGGSGVAGTLARVNVRREVWGVPEKGQGLVLKVLR